MVQSFLFFVCLPVVNMFLLGLSLAGHALQPMCPLFLALAVSTISMRTSEVFSSLMDSVITLQVIYVLSTFSAAHEPFSTSIPPSFSYLCVVCWADRLNHPTSLSGDPGSMRSLGSAPCNLNYQASGTLQEELWLGVGKK